ncbi:putative hemerythrin [Blattamonas nauphoetae]|uniref:Hemerythrin n=1 Tax=Blattamonas nauphoetae TaxID=2049346 RepID=A0ABQ9YAJ1_9EUKA|nr:putative hemerythrin [Blattamonas nauphoetae]
MFAVSGNTILSGVLLQSSFGGLLGIFLPMFNKWAASSSAALPLSLSTCLLFKPLFKRHFLVKTIKIKNEKFVNKRVDLIVLKEPKDRTVGFKFSLGGTNYVYRLDQPIITVADTPPAKIVKRNSLQTLLPGGNRVSLRPQNSRAKLVRQKSSLAITEISQIPPLSPRMEIQIDNSHEPVEVITPRPVSSRRRQNDDDAPLSARIIRQARLNEEFSRDIPSEANDTKESEVINIIPVRPIGQTMDAVIFIQNSENEEDPPLAHSPGEKDAPILDQEISQQTEPETADEDEKHNKIFPNNETGHDISPNCSDTTDKANDNSPDSSNNTQELSLPPDGSLDTSIVFSLLQNDPITMEFPIPEQPLDDDTFEFDSENNEDDHPPTPIHPINPTFDSGSHIIATTDTPRSNTSEQEIENFTPPQQRSPVQLKSPPQTQSANHAPFLKERQPSFITSPNMLAVDSHTVILNKQTLQDAVNSIVKEFRKESEVEPAIRFLQDQVLSRDSFTISFVDSFFRTLLKKDRFKSSPAIRMTYAMFLFEFVNSQTRMMSFIHAACGMFPSITDRWISFLLVKQIEMEVSHQRHGIRVNKGLNRNASITDLVGEERVSEQEAITLLISGSESDGETSTLPQIYTSQQQLKTADKHYQNAMAHMQMMWLLLSRQSVDCARVQQHAMMVLSNELEAKKIFSSLLESNPTPSVLRQYALLVRNISFDEPFASALLTEADRIEDENMEDDLHRMVLEEEAKDRMNEEEHQNWLVFDSELSASHQPLSKSQANPAPQRGGRTIQKNYKALLTRYQPKEKKSKWNMAHLPLQLVGLAAVAIVILIAFLDVRNRFRSVEDASTAQRNAVRATYLGNWLTREILTIGHIVGNLHYPPTTPQDLAYIIEMNNVLVESINGYFTFNSYFQATYEYLNDDEEFYSDSKVWIIPEVDINFNLNDIRMVSLPLKSYFYWSIEHSIELTDDYMAVFRPEPFYQQVVGEYLINIPLTLTEELKGLVVRSTTILLHEATADSWIQIVCLILTTLIQVGFSAVPVFISVGLVSAHRTRELRALCLIPKTTAERVSKMLEQGEDQAFSRGNQSESGSESESTRDEHGSSTSDFYGDTFGSKHKQHGTPSSFTSMKQSPQSLPSSPVPPTPSPFQMDVPVQNTPISDQDLLNGDDEEDSECEKGDCDSQNEEIEEIEQQRSDDVEEKLKHLPSVVPVSIWVRMILGLFVIIISTYAFFIIASVSMRLSPALSIQIVMNIYRSVYTQQLFYLTVVSLDPPILLDHAGNMSKIYTPTEAYTTPVFKSSLYASDIDELTDNIQKLCELFTLHHRLFLSGSGPDLLTGDSFFDSIDVTGLRGRYPAIDAISTNETTCLLSPDECSDHLIPGMVGSYNGLNEFIERFVDMVSTLTHLDRSQLDFFSDDIQFLRVTSHDDMQRGYEDISKILQNELSTFTSSYTTTLVVVFIVVAVILLTFSFACLSVLPSEINTISKNISRIPNLLKLTQDTTMLYTDEMFTGVPRFDIPHQATVELLSSLLTSTVSNTSAEQQRKIILSLCRITFIQFADEEKLMDEAGCPEILTAAHKRAHTTLLRKLVNLADSTRKRRASIEKVADFCSTWILDHYSTLDMEFGLYLTQHEYRSHMEQIPKMDVFQLPPSATLYYAQSTVSMEEKRKFERVPRDTVLFSFFYPLSMQRKHPNPGWEWVKYALVTLEMITLAFFCVDRTTHLQTTISKGINFVDFSSFQYILPPYFSFVSIGLLAYIVLLILYLLIGAVLHTQLIGKQPWVISLVRMIVEVTMTILLIPLLNMAIHQFDCHIGTDDSLYFRGTTISAFSDQPIPQAIGFALSIVFCVILFAMMFMYYLLIYQHNPKYGGMFSMPNFQYQLVQAFMHFGIVFAMRMLIDWPFWRFAVTVGVSALLVVWVLLKQPYYHFMGNYLSIVQWTVFGCIRALLELGYLICGFIKTPNADTILLIVTIVCGVVGLGAGIGLSILFFKLLKKRSSARWLLTEDGLPLTDPDDPIHNSLPKMKNYKLVEPAVRFIQEKEFKSFDYMNYVDLIYTTALKRHKTKADLQFHYANFLAHFKKNHVKAQSVYKTARMSSPSWPLRFLLFCQTKEKSNRGGVGNEMANAQFQLQMSKAEEMHDTAKNAMRDFFSNLTAPNPRLNVIPSLLHLIVDNEAKSRKIYEELLATHPQSTQLLRQYAALLLDIYHDEDMADIILQRADQIEEDSTVTLPTATGGTDPQAALQPMDPNAQKDEKASHMSGASGASGASMAKKKKKKKKKRGDALVTELGGGGGSDLKTTKKVVCLVLVMQHIFIAICLVVALVIYFNMSLTYSNDLSTLREVSRLAEYTGRTASFALMYCVHEMVYGFTYSLPTDGKTPSIMQVHIVQQGLLEGATFLTDITSTIFELTSYTDPWVSPDVDIYEFTMQNKTFAPTDPEVNTQFWLVNQTLTQLYVRSETMNSMTLISALTNLAQKSREMGSFEPVETAKIHPENGLPMKTVNYPTFVRDMAYMIANAPQPIMNGLKRAIFAYMDETTKSATTLLIVYLAVMLGSSITVTITILIVFIVFTSKMVGARKRALMDLLEVPKPKLQSVIRRLIAHSDDTMTGTMTVSMDESQGEEGGDSEGADNGASEASDAQEMEEGALGTANQVSESSRPPTDSLFSQDGALTNTQSNPLVIPPTTSPLGLHNFATPSDFRNPPATPGQMQFAPTPGQTISLQGAPDERRGSLLPLNTNFSIGLQPMGGLQTMSQVQPPTFASPHPQGNQVMSLLQMPQQSTSLYQSPQFNMTPAQGVGQTYQPFGMSNPLEIENQKKAEQKRKKAEEKKRKEEEEEKKRKAEEKKQREDEARRKKEEEEAILSSGKASDAQKGYIRNVISDEKWEEKLETDLKRLEGMHANLPSPLSVQIVISILLDMVFGLVSFIALAVLVSTLVNLYSSTNVNITMSGMRTSILALCEYFNLRIMFPLGNISPADKEITFIRSTNPVFKGFEQSSTNKTELYELLVKSSNYFQQLHSATHYGDSEYAFMNDTLYDDVPTTRLSTEENEATLLQRADCFMEEKESESCTNGIRIFNMQFPLYGLSTLISQMRLYIWMMKNDGYESYTNVHPVPRYLASAFRYDLRSGLNKLTNEILATSQGLVTTSQMTLLAVTVVACILIMVALIAFAVTWLNKVMQTNEESEKLLELMPVGHEEKEIDLLPSMLTGYQPMDQGRHKIIEAALSVFESLKRNEKMEVLLPNIDFLMITTTQVFAEEEAEMDKRDYEKMEEHKREHILIRQRLTRISEEIRKKQVAATRIAQRNLIRLYDRHFIDDDVQFGDTIPPEEKQAVHNDMEFVGEQAEDVGELGEPGQETN